jgi:NADH-quinone oxidoreductase subunit C
VTDSSPETPAAADGMEAFAAGVAATVGAERWSAEHGNAKVFIAREAWVDTIRKARDDAGLIFFSWLAAIDWTAETTVGEGVADPESVAERYEVLCWLGSLDDGRGIVFSTDVPKDDAVIDSLVPLFGGAEWHERETHEMFGIDFAGHPRLINLYLPDGFEGYPLRKSFALMSREVKPWPGDVDVEGMPEADA